MKVEIKLEELDRIIYQWDVVEGCKKKMIHLLCRIYGNPLNLDLADLDKPAYREVPKKGIIRESVESDNSSLKTDINLLKNEKSLFYQLYSKSTV